MKIAHTSLKGAPRLASARPVLALSGRIVSPLGDLEAVLPPLELGIPEAELTPRVRDAILAFLREMDGLRQELNRARTRLDEVEKAADQDPMLPVLNRRAFVRELNRHIAAITRYQTPASLIYLDLNHLKQTNDTLGHAAGDAMLIQFTRVLLAHVRESDRVGRLGGDEFAILLSHASRDQAMNKARLLALAAARNPAQSNGQAIPISFASGAFELKAGDRAEAAITQADKAMYAQKRAKRADNA
ncbi:MAG: GGDEF domain-containing protein [Rhizomicrobium sp.]